MVADSCLVGGFKYFYVHPYLGKIPILTNIFQRGWNHQLVVSWWRVFWGNILLNQFMAFAVVAGSTLSSTMNTKTVRIWSSHFSFSHCWLPKVDPYTGETPPINETWNPKKIGGFLCCYWAEGPLAARGRQLIGPFKRVTTPVTHFSDHS